jgi:integrase
MNLHLAIERLRDVLRRQHKALATESTYVHWLRHYVTALNAMPAVLSSEQKLERFLTDLARHRDLSANSQNQALNAILYFYKEVLRQPLQKVDALRAKRPARLRHAPTVAETQALLQNIKDRAGYPTNFLARLIYGCGLRVTEPLNLRIKDVNLEQSCLFLVGAKGGKDRVVSLPKSLAPEIVQQMKFAQAVWLRGKQNRIPVTLTHQLALKYPACQFAWPWAWLLPQHLFPSPDTLRSPLPGARGQPPAGGQRRQTQTRHLGHASRAPASFRVPDYSERRLWKAKNIGVFDVFGLWQSE